MAKSGPEAGCADSLKIGAGRQTHSPCKGPLQVEAADPRVGRYAGEIHGLVGMGRDEGTGLTGQGHPGIG